MSHASLQPQLLLKKALLNNKLSKVFDILQESPEYADVLESIPDGGTVLHIAILLGFKDVVQAMLVKPYRDLMLNYQDESISWTPLMHAISSSHMQIANLLLATDKCDLELCDKYGQSALHIYAQTNSTSVDYAKVGYFLMKHGSRIDLADKDGMTPFLRAIEANNLSAAKLLFYRRCDIYHSNMLGNTAVHIAAMQANVDILEWLVKIRFSTNVLNNTLQTPLMLCVQQRRSSIDVYRAMVTCITAGCDVNCIDANGCSALLLAVRNTSAVKAPHVKLLLCHNSNANIPDQYGITPLWQAIYDGAQHTDRYEIICLLVAYNCFLETPSHGPLLFTLAANSVFAYENALTPLDVAIDSGFFTAASLLIKAGADKSDLGSDILSGSPNTWDVMQLKELLQNPLCLRDITRISIRKVLNSSIIAKIHELPLPMALKDFCLFKDYTVIGKLLSN